MLYRLILVSATILLVVACDEDADTRQSSEEVAWTCHEDKLMPSQNKEHVSPHRLLEASIEAEKIPQARRIARKFAENSPFYVIDSDFESQLGNPEDLPEFMIYVFRRRDRKPLCPANTVLAVDKLGSADLTVASYNPDIVGDERLERLTDGLVQQLESELGVTFRKRPRYVPADNAD